MYYIEHTMYCSIVIRVLKCFYFLFKNNLAAIIFIVLFLGILEMRLNTYVQHFLILWRIVNFYNGFVCWAKTQQVAGSRIMQ